MVIRKRITKGIITHPPSVNKSKRVTPVPVAASVVAAGGAGGYTYSWSPAPGGGQGTPIATGLAAASYTVTVTDINGCQNTDQVLVTVYNLPNVDAGAQSELVTRFANSSQINGGALWQHDHTMGNWPSSL